MKETIVFHSPRIYYEIENKENSYTINVYMEGYSHSDDTTKHCRIENFSEDITTAVQFTRSISDACAMPVHIPELAEEFLSL